MKTLILKNESGIDVRYKADIIGNQKGAFTVMEITGLDRLDEMGLFAFKQLPYDFASFEKFAIDNNLTFITEEPSGREVVVLQKFTVSFDSNGGTPEIDSQIIPLGGFATEPDAPTLALNTFDGWSDDEGETIWNFDENVVTSDVALVAQWSLVP